MQESIVPNNTTSGDYFSSYVIHVWPLYIAMSGVIWRQIYLIDCITVLSVFL